MTIIHKPSSEADYIDLRSIMSGLVEKKWVIIGVSLALFTFVMIYAVLKPAKYQASLLLQVQQKQDSMGAISRANHPSNTESASVEPLSLQIALLRSKLILGPVIRSLGLDITVSTSSVLGSFFSKPSDAIHISELQLPAKYVKMNLHLFIDSTNHFRLYDSNHKLLIAANSGQLAHNNNNSITIKLDKWDVPVGSEFTVVKQPESIVLNKMLANLSILDISHSIDNNPNKIGILQISLIGNNPELITHTLNTIAFVAQKKNSERKSLEAENKLIFLKHQLPIVKSSLQAAEDKLNQYRSTTGKLDIKLQTHSLMTRLSDIDKQLQELRLKKAALLQQYTTRYPFVVSINNKINELDKLRLKIYRDLKKMPAADQSASGINRDIAVKQTLYMTLLNHIHELEVAKAGIISDMHILALASPPDMSIPIRLSIIGFVSLIAGLMLGCILVLGWKILSRPIDDPNWTERSWNIKNWVVIPHSKQQARLTKTNIKKGQFPLLAFQFPNDAALESICYLRTYLQLNHAKSHNNIITFMGLTQRVGKTFIIANLAGSLARIGQRVLLIDCDIRHGHLHQYFSPFSSPGLTDILTGKSSFENALVKYQDFQNLHFLPCGKHSEIPADMHASQQFKSLLTELSLRYQFVLINSAASMFPSDCALIGLQAGFNMLIMGANQHSADEINFAIKHLKQIGLQIDGTIFNHINPSKKSSAMRFHSELSTEPMHKLL